MMFNKILVITAGQPGQDTLYSLGDYKKLARDVFSHLNPASDIYFSQGPMDVLDHSCSKLGFGGKMCIDGSWKFEEEKEFSQAVISNPLPIDKKEITDQFPEIHILNCQLPDMDIPCLILSIQKNRQGHIRDLHQRLCALPQLEGIKMILYVESNVDANDLPVALWRFCNNVDPKRDSMLAQRPSQTERGKMVACMGLDGTIKTKEYDDFHRDWPNIIVADDDTIQAVDNKWSSLGMGEFIPSPSLKFMDQLYGNEAVADRK